MGLDAELFLIPKITDLEQQLAAAGVENNALTLTAERLKTDMLHSQQGGQVMANTVRSLRTEVEHETQLARQSLYQVHAIAGQATQEHERYELLLAQSRLQSGQLSLQREEELVSAVRSTSNVRVRSEISAYELDAESRNARYMNTVREELSRELQASREIIQQHQRDTTSAVADAQAARRLTEGLREELELRVVQEEGLVLDSGFRRHPDL